MFLIIQDDLFLNTKSFLAQTNDKKSHRGNLETNLRIPLLKIILFPWMQNNSIKTHFVKKIKMVLMAETKAGSIKITSCKNLAHKCFKLLLNQMDSRAINCLEKFQIDICYFMQNIRTTFLGWIKSN